MARLGGDEFAILLDETDLAQSIVVVERCLDSLKTPTLLGDSPVVAGASFGLVSAPDGGETADSLMRHADMAMYQAKRLGIGYHMYNGVLTNSELERIVLP